MNGDGTEEISINLEKLLVQNDASADVVLQSGDTIVLPALLDKVHIFGAVTKPGAHPYAPNRRLLDYIADAGGQTASGRISHVRVIRGDPQKPVILNCDLTKGVKGQLKDNPLLEPGDAVFVAERDFNSWRDLTGLLTTFGILRSLVN
jgi:polysaccharide export outer membrane protein